MSDLLRASCPTLGCPTRSALLVRPFAVRPSPRSPCFSSDPWTSDPASCPSFCSDPWLSDLLRASLSDPESPPWMSDPPSCPTLGYPTRLLVRPLNVRPEPGPFFLSDPWMSDPAGFSSDPCMSDLLRASFCDPSMSDLVSVLSESDPWISTRLVRPLVRASCPTLGCPTCSMLLVRPGSLSDPWISDPAFCPTLGCPTWAWSVLLVRPFDVRPGFLFALGYPTRARPLDIWPGLSDPWSVLLVRPLLAVRHAPRFLSDPWLSDLLHASCPTPRCPTRLLARPLDVRPEPGPCFLSDPWMTDPAFCPPLDIRPGFLSDPWMSDPSLVRSFLVRPLDISDPASCPTLGYPTRLALGPFFLSDTWMSDPDSCPTLINPTWLLNPCMSDLVRACCPTLGCPTCSMLLVRPGSLSDPWISDPASCPTLACPTCPALGCPTRPLVRPLDIRSGSTWSCFLECPTTQT